MKSRTMSHLALLFLLLPRQVASADDTFYTSDEYRDGEAGVVNVFLHEPEYRLMVEDIERNDAGFDWGWVRTVAFRPEPVEGADTATPPPASRGIRGRVASIFKRRPSSRPIEPEVRDALAFDLRAFANIRIPEVQNFAGIAKKELLSEIREAFVEGANALGLSATRSGDADLELGLALVDQLRGEVEVPVYNIHVQPHIELELRLTNLHTRDDLLLIRNRKHGTTQAEAALNFADDFVKFLR